MDSEYKLKIPSLEIIYSAIFDIRNGKSFMNDLWFKIISWLVFFLMCFKLTLSTPPSFTGRDFLKLKTEISADISSWKQLFERYEWQLSSMQKTPKFLHNLKTSLALHGSPK